MDGLQQMLNRLSYHLAGPHRRAFYSTLRKCLEKEQVQKNEEYLARVKVMEMYCLAADGLIDKAIRVFEKDVSRIKNQVGMHEIERIMLKKALFSCNLLEQIDTRKMSEKDKFELYIIGKNFDLCKKAAISLIKEHGKYAMSLMLVQNDFTGRNLSSLSLLLERVTVNNSLISLLLRKNIPYLIVKKHIRRTKDMSFLLLMKELALSGESIEEFGYPDVSSLIKELDDWEIYEYAIGNGISVHEAENSPHKKPTIHSIKYKLVTAPTPMNLAAYITKLGKIDSSACRYIDRLSIEDKGTLLNVLPPLFQRMLEMYAGGAVCLDDLCGPSDPKDKLYRRDQMIVFILETLLRRRTEESLMDALITSYACRKQSKFIHVISCALLRYLLLYGEFTAEFSEIGAENIQLEGLAYLWSDLQVLLGAPADLNTEVYMQTRSRFIAEANNRVMDFVEAEAYSQIEPLLEYRDTILNSPIYKQIVEGHFYECKKRPSIEKIVVEECRYIFDKIKRFPEEKECVLVTIHQIPKRICSERIKSLVEGSLNRVRSYMPGLEMGSFAETIVKAQEKEYSTICSRKAAINGENSA